MPNSGVPACAASRNHSAVRSLQSRCSVTIAPDPVISTPAKPSRAGSGSPSSTLTTTAASAGSPAATRIQCGKRPCRRIEGTGWPVSRIRKGLGKTVGNVAFKSAQPAGGSAKSGSCGRLHRARNEGSTRPQTYTSPLFRAHPRPALDMSNTVTDRPQAVTFQALIQRLNAYWAGHGCVLVQSLDLEVGAGTFHPATVLRALGPEPWNAAYVQPCRRPTDGRYGENPNRLGAYYQYQVAMKPSPENIVELYFDSLKALGVDPLVHDLRLVEDNWESPTLGAWGLGWEVWLNGMEVTQFTYFQQAGGLECRPVLGEITYGLERLCMYLQNVDNVFDIVWTVGPQGPVYYRDVYHQNEVEQSAYNFEHADVAELFHRFDACEKEALKLVELGLPLPAYEKVMQASHCFNLLDARRAISVTERQRYILRVRTLSRACAEAYVAQRA